MSDIDEVMSEDEGDRKHEPENVEEDDQINENDVIKILVASDIHLGYEQTTKRAQENDSFTTFEEILQYARDNEVDMLLLGGDLFHEAKPPHNVVMKCINLLRTYCLNDRPIRIQFLTDPEIAFSHCVHKVVNYEDPNINVGLPVFSIHGNHDDPSYGAVGSMDVLSSTGLINYFGKWTDVTNVSIVPLLLRKGATTVALYGLSYMNDQRLSRLMRNNKFELMQPKDIDPFNILVLHQNRAQHSQNSFVPEQSLPNFINLVIWGHEHECLITPESSKLNPNVFISQPGSSVATSLAQGESVPKHVGLLSIYKNKFKMEKLPLKTVRVFVFDNLVLNDYKDEISKYKSRPEAVEEFVDNYIENVLVAQAAEQQSGHPQQPLKPLIRLRIFYSDDRDVFDTLKLSQKYYNVAANPNDMILFRKCSSRIKKKDIKTEAGNLEEIGEIFKFDNGEKDWKRTVLGGMTEYFSQDDKLNKLTVLSLAGLNEALSRFVNANDTNAFRDLVKHQMKKTLDHLLKQNLNSKDEIIEAIRSYRDSRMKKENDEKKEEEVFFDERDKIPPAKRLNLSPRRDSSDDDVAFVEEAAPTRGKGRGRGRGRGRGASTKSKETTGSTPTKRSRTKAPALDITMDRGNQSLLSWKKASQSKTIGRVIELDSDSD